MSLNAEMNLTEQATPSQQKQQRKPHIYYLTLLLFTVILVVSYSFALYPLISGKAIYRMPFAGSFNILLNNYSYYSNPGFIWASIARLLNLGLYPWINVILRQLIITGICVWGITSLKKNKQSAVAALYSMAIYILYFILRFTYGIYYFTKFDVKAISVGEFLGYYFADYHHIIFIFFFAAAILCAVLLPKGLKKEPKPDQPANTEISGIRGWLVITAIRLIGTALNYLVIIVASILASFGVRGIVGMGSDAIFNYFQWDFSLANVFVLVFSLALLVIMFKKKYIFRPLIIAFESFFLFYGVNYLIYLIVFMIRVPSAASTYPGLIGGQVVAVLWSVVFIIYYLRSARVKNTFIN